MIAAIKFLHIAALSIWCAGLIGLPLVLSKHTVDHEQLDYARLRLLTHRAYVGVLTPAAVIAIAMGTALIFMRGVFSPWMFAKLVAVGVLVLLHAWIGHVTNLVGERQGSYEPPRIYVPVSTSLSVAAMAVILVLVLSKPVLTGAWVPNLLEQPQYQPLPVGEVPR